MERLQAPNADSNACSHGHMEQLPENLPSVGIAQGRRTRPFRVGHHTEYIARFIADPSDIPGRTIGVGPRNNTSRGIAVIIKDLAAGFQAVKRGLVCIIPTFPMGDGDLKGTAVNRLDMYVPAGELLMGIAKQGTGKQPGFAEDLKPVTDTEYLAPRSGEFNNALHHGTEPGDGAAAEVISIGESTRQYDAVLGGKATEVTVLVPEHDYVLVQFELQGILHIAVTIGTGENDDAEFHGLKMLKDKDTKTRGRQRSYPSRTESVLVADDIGYRQPKQHQREDPIGCVQVGTGMKRGEGDRCHGTVLYRVVRVDEQHQ
ncbi:MAG: hypothetical protein RJA57_1935 [Bacteroidota bacterium]